MNSLQQLPWQEPLSVASSMTDSHWALLYSGTQTHYSGRYSYLAHGLTDEVKASDFTEFSHKLSSNKSWYENMWFGYLGYGLKDCLEDLPKDEDSPINLPPLWMMRFSTIWRFDHERSIVERWGEAPILPATSHATLPKASALQSNMSSETYLAAVDNILEEIKSGNLYQANLTRKFFGHFDKKPDGFSLFEKLCSVSPAPYSAFLKLGNHCVISSSPELFLQIDPDGNVRTRPIKGTAPRFKSPTMDEHSRRALAHSEKDKAENLMIVDLMRNDLSRGCHAGSIQTSDIFEVTTHANIHHMSTTISGKKSDDCSTLDLVRHCFPPGSMTGAPKIRAMQCCSELEKQSRGVYAGSIGFFDGSGSCELSVVIRTLLLQGRQFEFQVGGGIVADSTAHAEQQETFDKALGLLTALGIPPEEIQNI